MRPHLPPRRKTRSGFGLVDAPGTADINIGDYVGLANKVKGKA
jgi:hypothetical protein